MRQPSLIRIFFFISIYTSLLLILIASIHLFKIKDTGYINNWVKKSTIKLTTDQLFHLLALEIPLLTSDVQAGEADFKQKKQDQLLLKFLPFYSLNDPKDLFRQEIPVFSLIEFEDTFMAYKQNEFPMELAPPKDFFESEANKTIDSTENKQSEEIVQADNNKKNVVFIYHTHNREAFLPEINSTKLNEAYHPEKNITLVGKKLAEELQKLGVGTVISTKDYWPELENYSHSYKYSLKTVQAALQQNKDIQFIFDIHRDANKREKTTKTINGKDYAAVYFIIGEGNKDYQQNKEFALKIHENLEKLYPGISKGIYEKKKTKWSNGEYNQSISPNSVTIEIGGVYNTLEEEYRTAKALAKSIAEIYWEAVKVDTSPQ